MREVPLAVVDADRVPAARYYDQAFFDLECEHLWPRVWQMACRLDEIPNVGDFVEYENLGKSVIVVRTADGECRPFTTRAVIEACRSRRTEGAHRTGSSVLSMAGATTWTVRTRSSTRPTTFEKPTSSRLSSI